ncbi:NADPH-dependent methylglyoxal reductase (D-lactaldehyde dehydrogenase) [Leucobacter sp. 7(1)]|uniref:NAD-dependent epimerase/dehydratase family protein n=1 Tax=Leucobacter sp. 7(1) TaxID=1255613 RepID=UPI00097F080A|nr:NAD-dependent epimerase/dehydratase family protein [Leucobacter sp. 7(1)]SJN12809.1 NADPH-dependent methylglyoxal reductase (D-lactaldehyde dehydrogenase) [Leucobacter sp. 7(1)]
MENSSLIDRSRPVLVTGVSGFLGGYIASELLAHGFQVLGTVRDLGGHADLSARVAVAHGVSGDRFSLCPADLTSDSGWDAAVADCRYVIHAASPFPSVAPRRAADVIRPAREGTRRVLSAAHRAGVQRVVLTSSVAATNHGPGHAPYSEQDWTDVTGRRATAYYRSKTLAEQDAWDFARAHRIELTVLNPGVILGPVQEPRVGASVGLIAQLLAGGFRRLPRFGFSIADVRDVADAHVRAMVEPKAAGKRFLVSGEFRWLRDVSEQLAGEFPAYAHRLPSRTAPDWFVRAMALADPHAREIVHELGRDLSVDTTRAREVLGWAPREERHTLRDTAQSLIDWGIVRAP